jgi:hypothetical protein
VCAHTAGKCSALIKVSEDLSDIFFGHSTWDSYTAMTRIYKHYEFDLQQVMCVCVCVCVWSADWYACCALHCQLQTPPPRARARVVAPL